MNTDDNVAVIGFGEETKFLHYYSNNYDSIIKCLGRLSKVSKTLLVNKKYYDLFWFRNSNKHKTASKNGFKHFFLNSFQTDNIKCKGPSPLEAGIILSFSCIKLGGGIVKLERTIFYRNKYQIKLMYFVDLFLFKAIQ